MVFPSVIPSNAKKKQVNGPYLIVAPSETTGNHHVVDAGPGVMFFEDEKGTIFMENKVETNIRCVMADRHDTKKLAPGTYEFGSQLEYDPFEARLKKVAD